MAIFLFIFGRDLMRLWVGSAYLSAYPLLVILTLGMGAGATQAGIQSMLFGIGKHKGLIGYRLGEAAAFILLGGLALKLWGLGGIFDGGFGYLIAHEFDPRSAARVPDSRIAFANLSS